MAYKKVAYPGWMKDEVDAAVTGGNPITIGRAARKAGTPVGVMTRLKNNANLKEGAYSQAQSLGYA